MLWVWKDVVQSVSQVGHTACVLKTIKGLMLPHYKKYWRMCCLRHLNAALLPKPSHFPSKSVYIKHWWPCFSIVTFLIFTALGYARLCARSSQSSVASANTNQVHSTVGSQANVRRQSTIWSGISTTTLVFVQGNTWEWTGDRGISWFFFPVIFSLS